MIRPVQESDWESIYQINNWYILNSSANFCWQPDKYSDFVQNQKAIASQYPYYVAEYDNQIIGFGFAHAAFGRISYQFDAELTIYFRPGNHYGMAGEMLERICNDLKAQNIHWLIGCITKSNETSIRFHQKHGFVFQGELPQAGWKDGKFHSVVWYGKELLPESYYFEQERRFIPRHELI